MALRASTDLYLLQTLPTTYTVSVCWSAESSTTTSTISGSVTTITTYTTTTTTITDGVNAYPTSTGVVSTSVSSVSASSEEVSSYPVASYPVSSSSAVSSLSCSPSIVVSSIPVTFIFTTVSDSHILGRSYTLPLVGQAKLETICDRFNTGYFFAGVHMGNRLANVAFGVSVESSHLFLQNEATSCWAFR